MFRAAVTLLLLALAAGCDDAGPLPVYVTRVLAVDAWERTPVTGVDVFLVDMDTGRIAAPPAPVDAAGRAEVAGLPDGRYAWFVRQGAGWTLAGLPPRAKLLPPGAAATPGLSTLELRRTRVGGAIRIGGRVLDGETGLPLGGVVIGLPGWPSRWDGLLPLPGDVTAADGTFLVHDVPFLEDPDGDDPPTQLQPLIFQAQGRAPRALRFEAPGFDFQEITGVEVVLIKTSPAGAGHVEGRVTHAGEPVAGVAVAAAWTGQEAKSGLAHPGLTAVTDAAGRFRLQDLEPGVWLLEPAFLPEDPWTPLPSPARVVTVAADSTVITADLPVLPVVLAAHPRPGAQNVPSMPVLRWTGVAAADSYRVVLDNAVLRRTADTHLVLDADQALAPGVHLWWVAAESAGGEVVGLTDAYQLFRVGDAR